MSKSNAATSELYGHRDVAGGQQDYWKSPREVWVKNISSIWLTIIIDADTRQHTSIPVMDDPICLTDGFPFKLLKKSQGLRTMLTGEGGGQRLLALCSEEEVFSHFARKAKAKGYIREGKPDVRRAVVEARKQWLTKRTEKMDPTKSMAMVPKDAKTVVEFLPPETVIEMANEMGNVSMGTAGIGFAGEAIGTFMQKKQQAKLDDAINQALDRVAERRAAAGLSLEPNLDANLDASFNGAGQEAQVQRALRPAAPSGMIVALCARAGADVPFEDRIPEAEFQEVLRDDWDLLSLLDLEVLMTSGFYPGIKAKAAKKFMEKSKAKRMAPPPGDGPAIPPPSGQMHDAEEDLGHDPLVTSSRLSVPEGTFDEAEEALTNGGHP